MPGPKELDPSASLEALYGKKLRRLRVSQGWTQRELGDRIPIAHSRIAQFELGNETPTEDVCKALDALLGADGDLRDLWGHINRTPTPEWSRKFMQYEAKAIKMVKYLAHTVPGLLQTEAYARALLRVGRAGAGDRIEATLSARLARQDILRGSDPPVLWIVLDEAVLHRRIGGAGVMRAQLARLLRAQEESCRVVVQVIPFDAGAHAVLGGSLTVLSFARRRDVAWLENSHRGTLVEDSAGVEEHALELDHLRASALPSDASADLIRSFMEGKYRDARVPRSRMAQEQLQHRTGAHRLHRGGPRYPRSRRRPGQQEP
ncbi:helix-turn-helix domain-containing protein [Streptomyces sp. NPDC018031]|uniref:helix-turn-helix domain-containing protein n=1 Tax=Streptomyces sp. NPDC018031 TaxID=3365033 RepID=UPI0037B803AE